MSKIFFNSIKVGIYLLFHNTRYKGLKITVKTPSFALRVFDFGHSALEFTFAYLIYLRRWRNW
jgi:hypothetical protein